MQILIVGADGFIGRHLSQRLLNKDYDIITTDIRGKNIFKCDLTDTEEIKNLFIQYSPETIIHLAGITSTNQSYQNVLLTQKINFMGTVNLIETAINFNANLKYFIFASSAEIYGGEMNRKFHENDLPQPRSPYAASKLAAESFIQMRGRSCGIDTCSIRFCNTFGRINNETFIVEYIFSCFSRNVQPVLQTPNSIRNFMYLPDHLKVYEIVLQKGPTGILNASSGEYISVLEIAHKIKSLTKRKVQIKTLSNLEPTSIILNTGKLRNLGYKPEYSLDNGLISFYSKIQGEKFGGT